MDAATDAVMVCSQWYAASGMQQWCAAVGAPADVTKACWAADAATGAAKCSHNYNSQSAARTAAIHTAKAAATKAQHGMQQQIL